MQRHARLLVIAYEGLQFSSRALQPTALAYGPMGRNKWTAYIDKFLIFPWRLRSAARSADIIHIADHSDSPLVLALSRSQVTQVTCHDLNAVSAAAGDVPNVRVRWSGRVYQRLVVRGLKRATRLIADSRHTAHDVEHYIGRSAALVPLPVDPTFLVDYSGAGLGREYALIVGGPGWRKGRLDGITAWLNIRQTRGAEGIWLHIVGPALTDTELDLFRGANALEEVVIQTGLSDQQLASEYAGAAFLLMLSRNEGFGWPVLEAACASRASLCSDIACLRETGGAGALYMKDVHEDQDWEEIANSLVSAELRSAARGNAEIYDFSKFQELLAVGIDTLVNG
jgi:glycosyltransferase involved in cell wall biosynthesis